MSNRRPIPKGIRFDIFRRDLFTCQYCGAQPPEATLEIDHILPVTEGGDNDEANLITSCEACNRGKGAKILSQPIVPFDPDIMRLETAQKLAELRRFQLEKHGLWVETGKTIELLQAVWRDLMEESRYPETTDLRMWLDRLGPDEIEQAFYATIKLKDRRFEDQWRYCCGAMWKMARGE